MRFTPKNEDELNPLIPAGLYDAEVIKAEEKQSKAGNDMIQICLRIYLADGNTVLLNDWLMEATQAKLLQFCNATGLRAVYDSGELQADHCLGKSVKVVIKTGRDKQDNEQNSVAKYAIDRPAPTEPSRAPVDYKRKVNNQAPYADPNYQAAQAAEQTEDIPF